MLEEYNKKKIMKKVTKISSKLSWRNKIVWRIYLYRVFET
jgi:hypothetical protein